MQTVAFLLRIVLGGLLVLAGALKLGDPTAFANEITNYRFFPSLAPWLAATLPLVEVALGLALVAAPLGWRRAAALATLALMAVFTVAVTQVVVRGINVDCGCFGGNSGPVTLSTVGRDLLLLAMAAAILWLERQRA
jgi:putative oxidoreductase